MHLSGCEDNNKYTCRLTEYNVIKSRATIEHEGASLTIDTTLLGVFDYELNHDLQFIGEMDEVIISSVLGFYLYRRMFVIHNISLYGSVVTCAAR